MELRIALFDRCRRARTTARRGFSFTEILFAVMILGIGFIMVAAMFPVAIQQTQNSGDDTVGAAVARSGADFMAQVAQVNWPNQVISNPNPYDTYSMLVPTFRKQRTSWSAVSQSGTTVTQPGTYLYPPQYPATNTFPPGMSSIILPGAMWSCSDWRDDVDPVLNSSNIQFDHWKELWSMVSPNMVQASDPRYAWVAFWKRDRYLLSTGQTVPLPYAQVVVIACRCRNTPVYSASASTSNSLSDITVQPVASSPDASLVPSLDQATITPDPVLQTTSITFAGIGNGAARAAEGAYVVICDDALPNAFFPGGSPLANTGIVQHGLLTGHVYRLGTFTGPNTWEFAPGNGLTPADLNVLVSAKNTYSVYVIGMGQDPNAPTGPRSGPAQDVAVYSTFVACPN